MEEVAQKSVKGRITEYTDLNHAKQRLDGSKKASKKNKLWSVSLSFFIKPLAALLFFLYLKLSVFMARVLNSVNQLQRMPTEQKDLNEPVPLCLKY